MKKGGRAKAMVSKPIEGKKDTSKPKGGKLFFGFTPKGRKGKKA